MCFARPSLVSSESAAVAAVEDCFCSFVNFHKDVLSGPIQSSTTDCIQSALPLSLFFCTFPCCFCHLLRWSTNCTNVCPWLRFTFDLAVIIKCLLGDSSNLLNKKKFSSKTQVLLKETKLWSECDVFRTTDWFVFKMHGTSDKNHQQLGLSF